MSILIKRAKPPKNCWECIRDDMCVAIAEMGGACPFTERIIVRDRFDAHSGIHPDCPLVEIPPHGRLIDADEILKYQDMVADCSVEMFVSVDDISDAPTVIESEVEE